MRAIYTPREAVNIALNYYDGLRLSGRTAEQAFAGTVAHYGMKAVSLAHALNQRDEAQAALAGEPVQVPDTFPEDWAA